MLKLVALIPFAVVGLVATASTMTLATPASAQACVAACPPVTIPHDPHDHGWDDLQRYRKPQMLIACRVGGEPEAMPDDLRFRNVGNDTIPAASRVVWLINKTGERGTFFLPHDLAPGHVVSDADVLKAGLPLGTNCLSKLT